MQEGIFFGIWVEVKAKKEMKKWKGMAQAGDDGGGSKLVSGLKRLWIYAMYGMWMASKRCNARSEITRSTTNLLPLLVGHLSPNFHLPSNLS